MFSNNLANSIQELLSSSEYNLYYVDQVPSSDLVKNYSGFVVWDIETITPFHNTEGVGYCASSTPKIIANFPLLVTVYGKTFEARYTLSQAVLDKIQPKVSGRRIPLKHRQLSNSTVRYAVWVNSLEFPIPKTAQSNAEMSATVLTFNCSLSISEL